MTKVHQKMLNDTRRLAQFKRAYARACRGKCPWSKIVYLREYWRGWFMFLHLKTWYPVPDEF